MCVNNFFYYINIYLLILYIELLPKIQFYWLYLIYVCVIKIIFYTYNNKEIIFKRILPRLGSNFCNIFTS